MFEDFHFLRPEWILLLLPAIFCAWIWVRKTQAESSWEKSIDDALLGVLMDGSHKKSNRTLMLLLAGAMVIATLGAAGPTWEKLPQNVERKNDALVILLDLSLSMLAEDTKPSRVERARQKIADILRLREEGQTAVVAYAGDAHAVVPLTDDVATIMNLLPALSPEMMPVFGSNPDHALEIARELFTNGGMLEGKIIMVTDGIDDISSVSKHRSRSFPISIIGLGTQQGGPIPLDRLRQPGRFYQTQEGNQVVALRDDRRLGEVAALTFGNYSIATLGDDDILRALEVSLPSEDATLDVDREFDTWFDQGHWLAVLLLPVLLLAFRRGVFAVVLIGVLNAPSPVLAQQASENNTAEIPASVLASAGLDGNAPNPVTQTLGRWWDTLWYRDDQLGASAMRFGEPEKAAVLFEDHPQWRSAAEYRSGEYTRALAGFESLPTLTDRYNEGNALARLGDYEQAIEQYEQVLATRPDHEDAQFNKELVERLLQEQQQAQEQQNQDQQSDANNEDSEAQQDQQQQDQQQSDQDQQSDESEQQDDQQEQQQNQEQQEQEGRQEQAENEQEEVSRDEKQEALEQWLRRVPDDPGGLLRRKFSHETKQRLRRGDYENRQGDKIW